MEIKFYFFGFLASFIMVFLKGFQHQNVIGGHYKLAFIFSYLMAIADITVVSLVVAKGWSIAAPSGTGAAFGIVISMWLHRRYVSK